MSLRKFVAVMPQEFNNSLNDSTEHEKLRKKNFDKAMRWSMTFVGLLSGSASLVENKYLQKFVTAYHFVICCCMTANFICSAIMFASTLTVDFMTASNTVTILLWTLQATVCTWIFFVQCHRRTGFPKYYLDLQKHLELCAKMNLNVGSLKFRLLRNFTVISGWLISLVLIGFQVFNAIVALQNSPSSSAETFQWPIYIFLNICFFWTLFHWSMQTAYIAAVSQTIWQLAEAFNNKFQEAATSPSKTVNHLESYRETHLNWCRLVATANKSLRLIIAVTIICSMTTSLVLLYLIANMDYSSSSTMGGTANAIFIFISILISLIIIIVFADQAGAATGAIYDDLVGLYEPGMEISNTQQYQMQLFLSRVEKPEEFSVGGLIPVNRAFGLTILGMMLTYYIVLQQMGTELSSGNVNDTLNCA